MYMNEVYKELVQKRVLEFNGEPISNGQIEHAAILVVELVRVAKKELNLFVGNLNSRVYGQKAFVEEVRTFLGTTGRKVKIILEAPEEIDVNDHRFVREFASNDDVEFFTYTGNAEMAPNYHFVLADGHSYRFEADKKSISAVAAFNDPKGAGVLAKRFNTFLVSSKKHSFSTLADA